MTKWKCPKCNKFIETDTIIRKCPHCNQSEGGYILQSLFDEPAPKPELTRIMYHGTTEENAKSILETGFREGTYFTKDLASAIIMGGRYIFTVWFTDEEHTTRDQCWEYITPTPVPKEKILSLRRFSQERLFMSPQAKLESNKYTLSKMYPGKEVCTICNGNGQLEQYDDYDNQWKNHLPVMACPECSGHGVLKRWED